MFTYRIIKLIKILTIVIICISIFPNDIKAETFCISNASELQFALSTAATNSQSDTVKVVQGTYYGNFIFSSAQSQSLVIQGGYNTDCTSRSLDPNNTILDGGNQNQVLALASSESFDLYVEGITFQNGQRQLAGAGMYILTSGNVVVNKCNIIDNIGGRGTGIYIEQAEEVRITNCIFENNKSSGWGGGIALWSSLNLFITDNEFRNNIAHYGGGLYVNPYDVKFSGCSLILNNNHFEGNSTTGTWAYGGGAYLRDIASINALNNTFIQNTSTGPGGGMYLHGEGVIDNNDFIRNVSWFGGGLDLLGGVILITRNTFIENNSTWANVYDTHAGGGGIHLSSHTPRIINNLFIRNHANWGGQLI